MVKDVLIKAAVVKCIQEHNLNVVNLWVQIRQYIVGMLIMQLKILLVQKNNVQIFQHLLMNNV